MIIQRKYFDEELNGFVFTKSFSISELPQENEITIGKMGLVKHHLLSHTYMMIVNCLF